jgi:serine protease Do
VLKVDGKEVTPDQTLSFIVANTEPGKRIPLEIIRDGQRSTLSAVVGRRPSEEELAAQVFNPDEDQNPLDAQQPGGVGLVEQSLGLQVMPLTPQIASQLGMSSSTQGLVIANADPNSDAGAKGLGRGTVIVSANGRQLSTVEDLESTVRAAKSGGREAVLLRVRVRGAPEVSVPVRLR